MDVGKLSLATVAFVVQHWRALVYVSVIPALLNMVLNNAAAEEITPNQLVLILFGGLVVGAVIEVATYRIVLLNQSSRFPVSLTHREILFVLRLFILGFLFIPAILFLASPIISLILFGVALWVIARLSLIFPAISIDRRMSYRESWYATEPYQVLIFFAAVLLPMLLTLLIYGLRVLPYPLVVVSIASVLLSVVRATAISVVYRHIFSANHD
ncbi:MAG: hypothetical protein AAF438_19705 [Pseudomonadota bacterium]